MTLLMKIGRKGAKFAVASTLLIVALTSAPALACDSGMEAAAVVSIEDGETMRLDHPVNGATEARLAGVRLAQGSLADFASLADGMGVCLRLAAIERDRYGRLVAYVYRNDGLWLQGELLRRGLARVEPSADAQAFVPEMLAIERDALAASVGAWGTGQFRARTPTDVAATAGSFQLVEGRVLDAVHRKSRWYLNFGADWRSDFTVVIPKSALAAFAGAGLEPYSLKGRIVRVRGWVDVQNGPLIEVQVPEQIEVIESAGITRK